MKAKIKKLFIFLISIVILIIITSTGMNLYIYLYSKKYIYSTKNDVPSAHTVIILGAQVYSDGRLSSILYDRVTRGHALYCQKKVKRFLLSGDHGTRYYDEVNKMKDFLLKKGVPGKHIFLDHAGFDTYNSMVRAQKIFKVKKAIVVTQRYHLYRALYIARKNGIDAFGYVADRRRYKHMRMYKIREFFANVKAFIEVFIDRKPIHEGNEIPITGDGRASWD